MPIIPINTYDDEVLRSPATRIQEDSEELQQLIDDMFETMYHARGVGLAAPQIGKSIRLFVVDVDVMAEEAEEPKYGPNVFINPEIISKGDEQVSMEEGCLSIPGETGDVIRAEKIKVRSLDREGSQIEFEAEGFEARAIQHEIDHLNGVLFVDKIVKIAE